jgi:hypothetical protein
VAFTLNITWSPATRVGITNSDSCSTATTFWVVVEARVVLSIEKPVAENVTHATVAVRVISVDVFDAIAHDTELFIASLNELSVLSFEPVKACVIVLPSIFIKSVSPEMTFLGRVILSTCATAGTLATWFRLRIVEAMVRIQPVKAVPGIFEVSMKVSIPSYTDDTSGSASTW